MTNAELEQELMHHLRELTNIEQNEISVLIAIYADQCARVSEG